MLFFLTGNIQTGKTRWLESVLDELCTAGVGTAGVLAPGIWRDHGPEAEPRYEKLGIDNLLLPQGERVPFARRADLAIDAGTFDAASQAARAQLAWAIDDEALAQVNSHFDELGRNAIEIVAPSLLIVDELGRLELLRGEGLTSAMRLLDAGDSPTFPHALVIVRTDLLPAAFSHFVGTPWCEIRIIHADDEGKRALFEAFDL